MNNVAGIEQQQRKAGSAWSSKGRVSSDGCGPCRGCSRASPDRGRRQRFACAIEASWPSERTHNSIHSLEALEPILDRLKGVERGARARVCVCVKSLASSSVAYLGYTLAHVHAQQDGRAHGAAFGKHGGQGGRDLLHRRCLWPLWAARPPFEPQSQAQACETPRLGIDKQQRRGRQQQPRPAAAGGAGVVVVVLVQRAHEAQACAFFFVYNSISTRHIPSLTCPIPPPPISHSHPPYPMHPPHPTYTSPSCGATRPCSSPTRS